MKPLVTASLPASSGNFEILAFESGVESQPHLVLRAERQTSALPLVRIHSECWTGDVVGSLKCDCGPQLNKSLELIAREGGAVVYLRQEGRGIGLIEKKNKNCIQWRGAVPGSNTQESVDRLAVLKEEIDRLDDFEKIVDQHKSVRF